MSKLHLTYKVNGVPSGAAFCGNNNRNYKLGLRIAGPVEFRQAPDSERCAHCEQIYLEQRNKVRKAKGLPPVKSAFEGLTDVGQ